MRLEYSKQARREFKKLDLAVQKRIKAFMEKIVAAKNPRAWGKPLLGNLAGIWRYRVGDYRIFCEIQNEALLVLVVEIGHRKDIYKSR